MKEIVMPKLGLTMTEGTVSQWLKKEGDAVQEGEKLFEVETDKITNTIEASASGTLLKIYVPAGSSAQCLQKVAVIGDPGEALTDEAPAQKAPAAPAKAEAPAKVQGPAEGGAKTVLVIGGGPGGYVAAIRAAQLGAKVTLVEKDKIGGTCLNCGCIPTKALLHSAEVYDLARHSEDIGVACGSVELDWSKVQSHRQAVIDKLVGGVGALLKANKVTVIKGEAQFTGPKTVAVGGQEISADRIIVATGSYPIIPPIPGVKESKACMDSTAALALEAVPQSLLIIGGGVIGIELGSAYQRFGAKVTVVEMLPKLLPLMDGELTAMVRAQLEGEGMEILTDSAVLAVADTASGADVTVKTPSGERVLSAEKVLVCVGRGPNTAGLALDKAGIASQRGYIQTDDRLETNVPGVYAIGDCNGKLMLAHTAMAMGEAAAENALGGNLTFSVATNPSCVYTVPEFAGVGFTEERCQELGLQYKVGRFPTSANGKSLIAGQSQGMIKVLAGAQYGEILGVHILADRATDLIQEAALAIGLEATLEELIDTIHGHPTVAEGLREAALAAEKRAVHIPNKK